MVKSFVCPPDVGVLIPSREPRVSHRVNEKSSRDKYDSRRTNFSSAPKENVQDSDVKVRKEEVKQLMCDVKEYSAKSFTGLRKKRLNEDTLTKLGVSPEKQQTMPLKMALGIRDGRNKRLKKQIDRSRESGVVVEKSISHKTIHDTMSNTSSKKKRKRIEKSERRSAFDVGTKGGVLYLSKQRRI